MKEQVKQAMNTPPPENYKIDKFLFYISNCPGYKGYVPKNLGHEVCKHCGSIQYYH